MEYWSDGVMEYWSDGMMEWWRDGVMEGWSGAGPGQACGSSPLHPSTTPVLLVLLIPPSLQYFFFFLFLHYSTIPVPLVAFDIAILPNRNND